VLKRLIYFPLYKNGDFNYAGTQPVLAVLALNPKEQQQKPLLIEPSGEPVAQASPPD